MAHKELHNELYYIASKTSTYNRIIPLVYFVFMQDY